MKKEKYVKKLFLNKTTISNFDQHELTEIKGGRPTTSPPICDSIEIRCNSHTGCTGCPIEC